MSTSFSETLEKNGGCGPADVEATAFCFRTIIEGTSVPFVSVGEDGRLLFFNSAFAALVGYSTEELQANEVAEELTPPEWRARESATFLQARQSATPQVYEKEYQRKDGMRIPAEVRVNAVRAGDETIFCAFISDSSSRKEAERERSAREERLREAIDNLPAVCVLYDHDGTIAYLNKAALELTGKGASQVLGRRDQEVWDDSVTRHYLPHLARAFETKAVQSFEMSVTLPGGKSVSHLITYLPMLDTGGKVAQVLCLGQDLTNMRQTKEALRRSEERLALAQATGGVGVYDWNLETGEILWSAQLESIYGMPMPEDAGERQRAWASHVHVDDAERLARETREWLDSTESHHTWEFRFIRPDGQERWISGRSLAIRDAADRPLRVIGTNVDITERKAAEKQLQESAERLRLAATSARLFAFEWDAVSDTVNRDGAAEDILGVSSKAEHSADYFSRLHPEDRSRFVDLIQSLSLGRDHYSTQYRVRRPDGGEVWLEESGQGFFDSGGRLMRLIGMTADITLRKRAELAFREGEKRLRFVLENSPDYISLQDSGQRYVWSSRAFGHVSPDQCFGYTDLDLAHLTGAPEIARELYSIKRRVMEENRGEKLELTLDVGGSRRSFIAAFEPWRGDAGEVVGVACYAHDITELKRTEEALREKEATLNAILDALPVAVSICDPDGKLIRLNDANRDLWGNFPETSRWQEYGNWVGFRPDTGERLRADEWTLARALRTGETIRDHLVEIEQFGTGARRFSLNYAAPVRDTGGAITAAVCAQLDVTDRIMAERRLQETARRLRVFFDSEMVGTLYWNMDGRIVDANEHFLRMVGYSREELASRAVSWATMTPPEYRDADERALDQLRRRGVDAAYEKEFIRKDGSRVPVIIGAAMLDANQAEGVAFVLDITERKRAEQALRLSEGRLKP